jgi:uncharacterized membrane protein
MLWLVIGLLIGAGVFWLATNDKVKLTWYEWVIGVVGIILILFAIQNYGASLVELEPRAASFLMLIFGLPGLVFIVIAGVLAFLRARKQEVSKSP